MSDYPDKATGGCHCGAIRYTVTQTPEYVAVCHCESCRKTTGAPAVVYAVYPDSCVQFLQGSRKVYESSPDINRTFCGDCGTPLSYEAEWQGERLIGFFIGTLDEPDLFPPKKHVFHEQRIGWFEISDQLPRYFELPKAGREPDQIGPVI
ncbi:GFA family protein [Kiloniella sp.]|uniref:GFA family protein n=1 Tax=Kiloniella sp. TaxID=1938587 RepID=UPI003B01519D